ncbi:MAG: hypothetical protein BWY83_00222 [bacterium ADurb.Bin478]|nr:MAG: hypothetical protein BWY83_00222 [bacterium ADurb.Bin478]
MMDKEILTAVALGIGLSAGTGFRVFIPLLIAGIAARFGVLPMNESFAWLSSNAGLGSLGVATVVEIAAYYIPFVDNLLDHISTPLSIGAGTLISASVLPIDNEMVKWLSSFILGGGSAALVQGATAALRLGSSGTTGGAANFLLASGENIAAIVTPILSILLPMVMAILILLTFWIAFRLITRRKKA